MDDAELVLLLAEMKEEGLIHYSVCVMSPSGREILFTAPSLWDIPSEVEVLGKGEPMTVTSRDICVFYRKVSHHPPHRPLFNNTRTQAQESLERTVGRVFFLVLTLALLTIGVQVVCWTVLSEKIDRITEETESIKQR